MSRINLPRFRNVQSKIKNLGSSVSQSKNSGEYRKIEVEEKAERPAPRRSRRVKKEGKVSFDVKVEKGSKSDGRHIVEEFCVPLGGDDVNTASHVLVINLTDPSPGKNAVKQLLAAQHYLKRLNDQESLQQSDFKTKKEVGDTLKEVQRRIQSAPKHASRKANSKSSSSRRQPVLPFSPRGSLARDQQTSRVSNIRSGAAGVRNRQATGSEEIVDVIHAGANHQKIIHGTKTGTNEKGTEKCKYLSSEEYRNIGYPGLGNGYKDQKGEEIDFSVTRTLDLLSDIRRNLNEKSEDIQSSKPDYLNCIGELIRRLEFAATHAERDAGMEPYESDNAVKASHTRDFLLMSLAEANNLRTDVKNL